MTHISYEQNGVDARYVEADCGDFFIELDDTSYVKAEHVLFNPDTNAIHAVMHEGVFLIGIVPADCVDRIRCRKEVVLSANHFSGVVLRLKASVVCTH